MSPHINVAQTVGITVGVDVGGTGDAVMVCVGVKVKDGVIVAILVEVKEGMLVIVGVLVYVFVGTNVSVITTDLNKYSVPVS